MPKKSPSNQAERIIIAVALIACAAIIGYAAKLKAQKPIEYDIGETKQERIEEIISLQNQLFVGGEVTIGKININTASLSQLKRLEGVGETKAKAIIEYREQNGGFDRVEDIMKVPGIGEKTFEKFKDNIEV